MKEMDKPPRPGDVWDPIFNIGDEILNIFDEEANLFQHHVLASSASLKKVSRNADNFGARKLELEIASSRARAAILIFDQFKDSDARSCEMCGSLVDLFWQSCELGSVKANWLSGHGTANGGV